MQPQPTDDGDTGRTFKRLVFSRAILLATLVLIGLAINTVGAFLLWGLGVALFMTGLYFVAWSFFVLVEVK